MANIKIIVEGPLMDGHKVTFKAPCECFEVEKLNVFYVKDNAQVSRLFTMKDTHGNDLTGIGNLFTEGAYVHAILDTVNGFAYLQNADNNGYIDNLNNARFDARYDTPIVVGKRGDKKVYRVRKKYTVNAEYYERTSIAHGVVCSDIWFDVSQSFCSVTSSDMYVATDRIPLVNPNLSTCIDNTNINVFQTISESITLDVILYYVEV